MISTKKRNVANATGWFIASGGTILIVGASFALSFFYFPEREHIYHEACTEALETYGFQVQEQPEKIHIGLSANQEEGGLMGHLTSYSAALGWCQRHEMASLCAGEKCSDSSFQATLRKH